MDLETNDNFLATQVWPAARVASLAVQKHAQPDWNIIEMGCGPGLPSLTAASLGCDAIATDVDGFALQLVQAAANEQGFTLQTKRFDLINDELDSFPDLVILSDVFEHASVAVGAARVTIDCLSAGSRVWVFCQSDRAQRQGYIEALQESSLPFAKTLAFSNDGYNPENQLWLCDLDELDVRYG